MSLTDEQIEGGEIAEQLVVALCVIAAGLAFLIFGGFDVSPDALLYRRFGPEGADRLTRAIGALVTLAGGLWIVRCIRRLLALKRRREGYLPPFDPNNRG